METEKKRIEYTNGEIVVVWQPHLCIHSGVCVRMLPEVYNPQEDVYKRQVVAFGRNLQVAARGAAERVEEVAEHLRRDAVSYTHLEPLGIGTYT